MKITKSKLKQIIKEELSAIVLEKEESRAQKLFKQIFSDLRGMGKSKDEAFEKAREIVANAPKGAAAPGLKFENEDAPIDLYSDYDEDPVKALEKRRAELKKKIVGGNPEAMDAYEEWLNLGKKLQKLKENKVYDEIDEEIDHLEGILVSHMPDWAIERYEADPKTKGAVRDDMMKLAFQEEEVYEYIQEISFAVRNALQGGEYISPDSLQRLEITPMTYVRPMKEASNPMTTSARGWDYSEPRALSGGDVTGTYDPPRPEKKYFKILADFIRYDVPPASMIEKGRAPIPTVEGTIEKVNKLIDRSPHGDHNRKMLRAMFNEDPERLVKDILNKLYNDPNIVVEQ